MFRLFLQLVMSGKLYSKAVDSMFKTTFAPEFQTKP